MPKANLTKEAFDVLSGMDGIIIRKHIYGLEAGRVIDTAAISGTIEAYSEDVIPCGIPVISKEVSGVPVYKVLPPTDVTEDETTTYGFNLPSGYSYVGIAAATVRANQACPVMNNGVVNEKAMLNNLTKLFPSGMETPTALSLSDLKSACPHLQFMSDETMESAS